MYGNHGILPMEDFMEEKLISFTMSKKSATVAGLFYFPLYFILLDLT